MDATTPKSLRRPETTRTVKVRIARRVAVVAGAAGTAVAGEVDAAPLNYVPTAGVVAAQGIPGFSFTPPTTVTTGTLRPPASDGVNGWDIDGNGSADFNLRNGNFATVVVAAFQPLAPFTANPNALLNFGSGTVSNLAGGAAVGPSASVWIATNQMVMTLNQGLAQSKFTLNQVGYFGFRFASSNNTNEYYYGWASLTIDASSLGQGFKIGEAFYQSTPNTAIDVGAVPVPEPSSMALLAAGATGVTAWRARRKKQPATE